DDESRGPDQPRDAGDRQDMSSSTDTFTPHGPETAGEDLAAHVSAETGKTWTRLSGVGATVGSDGRVHAAAASWSLYAYGAQQATPDTPVEVDLYFPGTISATLPGVALLC